MHILFELSLNLDYCILKYCEHWHSICTLVHNWQYTFIHVLTLFSAVLIQPFPDSESFVKVHTPEKDMPSELLHLVCVIIYHQYIHIIHVYNTPDTFIFIDSN